MPENEVSKLFSSHDESEEPELVQINGFIPEWIAGTFLRTGPAKWDLDQGQFTVNHFMDGYAMISKFDIDPTNQTVSLDKKFLKSEAYLRGIAAQRPVVTEYGTPSYPDPNRSFFSKLLSACLPIELSDNNSSAIFRIGSEIFATSETCYFWSINSCTLGAKEKYDSNKCFGVNIDSAHPLIDEIGNTWNMGYTFLTGLKYNLYKIPAPATTAVTAKDVMRKSKIVTTIPSSWNGLMSYNHQSFVLTSNYVIFIEQPFIMNIGKAAKSILRGSPTFSEYLEWRPELRNRFFVIDKSSGKILTSEIYAVDSFFFLHFVNAYEESNQVVVDLITYPNVDLFDDLYLSKLRSGRVIESTQGSAHRFVIPLGDVKEMTEGVNVVEVKSDAEAIRCGSKILLRPGTLTYPGIEYPIINRKMAGKKHKYWYATGTLADTRYRNSITKFDNSNFTTSLAWIGTSTEFPGEPQFLPNPDGKGEDDAILVSAVSNSRHEVNDFLLFLDAKTMTEIGRAQFQSGIPPAMHGLFSFKNGST